MRKTLLITTVAAMAVATLFIVQAQEPGGGQKGGGKGKGGGQPVQPAQQIKPGLYLIAGGGANSLARVTNEGVILMDSKNPGDQNYDPLMEQIKAVTNQPVKFMFVTHHHADHTGNTAKFLEAGVTVIGQENLKKNLVTYNFNPKPGSPSVTYDKDYVIRLGGVEVQLHHFGRSHTSGDTVAYYPDLKVVAVSDAVTTNGQGPLVDYGGGGSATEWVHVLDDILKLDFDTCVPGAGGLLTKADVQAFRTKFETFVSRATELIKKGVPKEQLLAQIKTDDLGWTPRIPDVGAFYEELSKAK